MPNLNDMSPRFESARKALMQKLTTVQSQWLDAVGQSFEKNYAAPLPAHIKVVQRELERLRHVIEQAKREVK